MENEHTNENPIKVLHTEQRRDLIDNHYRSEAQRMGWNE